MGNGSWRDGRWEMEGMEDGGREMEDGRNLLVIPEERVFLLADFDGAAAELLVER